MTYYFLAAQLPSLAFAGPPPMSGARFRALCAERMTASDAAAADEALAMLGGGGRAPQAGPLAGLAAALTQIANAVARARCARAGRDAGPHLRPHAGFDAGIERGVADAFGRRSPLDRERALDLLRWQAIDAWAGLDGFSLRAIVAYGLKLAILERWEAMSEARGAEKVERFVAAGSRVDWTP